MESMSYLYLAMTNTDDQSTMGDEFTAVVLSTLATFPVFQLPPSQPVVADDCDRQDPLYPTLYF